MVENILFRGTGFVHLTQSSGRVYGGAAYDYTFDLTSYNVADKSASDFTTLMTANMYIDVNGTMNCAPNASVKSFNPTTKQLIVSAAINGYNASSSAYRTIHLFFSN